MPVRLRTFRLVLVKVDVQVWRQPIQSEDEKRTQTESECAGPHFCEPFAR